MKIKIDTIVRYGLLVICILLVPVFLIWAFLSIIGGGLVDNKDLFSEDGSKMTSRWNGWCDSDIEKMKNLEDIIKFINSKGYFEKDDMRKSKDSRRGLFISSSEDTVFIKIIDSNVRNWELDLEKTMHVSMQFESEKVLHCGAGVRRHGT